jgi:hypothetical protein
MPEGSAIMGPMRMATSIAIFVVAFGVVWLTARRWRRRAEQGQRLGWVARAIGWVVRPLAGLPRTPKQPPDEGRRREEEVP